MMMQIWERELEIQIACLDTQCTIRLGQLHPRNKLENLREGVGLPLKPGDKLKS